MTINDIIQKGVSLASDNPAGAVAAGIIALYLLVKKPKLLLTLVFIALAAAGVMQLFDMLSSTGLSGKTG